MTPPSPEIQVLPDAAAVAAAAADAVVAAAEEAVRARGTFRLALSGGSTPKALYALLAEEPRRGRFPWPQAHIFFGDERCVPPDHKDSNFRMAHEAMLAKVPAPVANVHRVRGEEPDAARAAADYEAEVRRAAPDGRLDLVLLGLGADAHTASIFPGTRAVHERERWVVSAWVEKLGARRVTFAPPLLNAAREVLFLVAGPDKPDAVHAVLRGPRDLDLFPAQVIAPADGRVRWLLDRAAAAKLEVA